MDKQFDAQYIDKEFEEIGRRIKRPISIYLIGGCAMSFRGLKESTKDVDIVFKHKEDLDLFIDALWGAQYFRVSRINPEHEQLDATKIFENKDKFHLDLFLHKVIRKLSLSGTMIARAEQYKTYHILTVYLLSREDIFLFKALASEGRKRDLPDMERLYPNLNWQAIEEELKSQRLSEELIQLFIRRTEEFSRTFNLDVPLLARLKKIR